MAEISLKVRAKINLSLGINGVTENGYHDLDMLLASVDGIYDIIRVYDSNEIVVTMDGKVQDERNTAYKSLALIKERFGVVMSADIKKGIPFSAGLGGSSCDSAGVFCAFHALHGVKMDALIPLADEVGSDVAFMMRGGAAISRGQGSDLTYVELPCLDVVVMKAKGGSNTGAVFRHYDSLTLKSTIDNPTLVAKIQQGKDYSSLMLNQLYIPASELNDEIARLYLEAKKITNYVVMSGSGSSIVAVVHNAREKERLLALAESAEYSMATRTIGHGVDKS